MREQTERNKRICELRGTMSAAQIAKLVGCTRNAVIGVWSRAGLCEKRGARRGFETRGAPDHIRHAALKAARLIGVKRAAYEFGVHDATVRRWKREAAS
jgi:hypothetical protein